jgi:hypothetical protein
MTTENYYVLAFDIDDTNKIVQNLKNKKKNILALTPNAFEILKSNKFENIITPHNVSKNLHQNLAEDNIKFRDQLNYISKKNKNAIFSEESFKNIIIQCFSTLNFFSITLKKNSFYYLFLDNKFELNSKDQAYHKLIDLIIIKKYGIFKINRNNNKKLFYFKKIINDFLFFFIKKKKIIFNFLGNKKKLSYSKKSLEITFGTFSNSYLANFYLLGKSFFQFFINGNIKIVYPEVNYKKDFKLKEDVEIFLNLLNFEVTNNINKNLIYFLYENILYEQEIKNFLEKRFKNLNLQYLFADHLTWMDPFCVASFLYNKKLPVFLSSHGMIDLNEKKYEKNELVSLANGLCFSKYASTIIAQTPMTNEVSNKFLDQYNYNIIKTHPIAYNGLRQKKNSKKKTINILFAGTYKVFLSRPYIYQDSFEFFQTIKKLLLVFRNLKDVNLVLNIRTNDEIDNIFFKKLVEKDFNIKMIFNANIEELMQESDMLITNFSTLIDEYSYLNKPVIIIKDHLRYECYKDLYLGQIKDEFLNPIYYLKSEELNNEISDILEKIKKDVKVNKLRHIWPTEEAVDNQTLLKTINE